MAEETKRAKRVKLDARVLDVTGEETTTPQDLDFSTLDLICPVNPNEICNRWLSAFVPGQSQQIKVYPARVASFIFRTLKAYAGIGVHGRGSPPFIHWSQLQVPTSSHSLSFCLGLIRTCDTLLPGSSVPTADILQNQVRQIYQQHVSYSDMTLLGAFQACLIYCLVLQFWLGQESDDFLRQAVMDLQQVASASSAQGLATLAEQQGIRPTWEAWIATETKRRTLYTMYLFDNVLSAQDGLPMTLGTELRGLPAPASKTLWQARSRTLWDEAYNAHLAAFPHGGLRIDELWPPPADEAETARKYRRSRIDLWLEDLDEFGTMLYAVTSITHGE